MNSFQSVFLTIDFARFLRGLRSNISNTGNRRNSTAANIGEQRGQQNAEDVAGPSGSNFAHTVRVPPANLVQGEQGIVSVPEDPFEGPSTSAKKRPLGTIVEGKETAEEPQAKGAAF